MLLIKNRESQIKNPDAPIRTLWLTGMLHAFTHMYFVALMPLYLLVESDLKLPNVSWATLLLTVQMLAYFLPSYLQGVWADHYNRKRLLALGLAINGAGFVVLGFAPNYPAALLGVVIAGFGGSFYHPAATAWIAQLFPRQKGKAFGYLGIGASVGFFIGPVYVGWRTEMLEPAAGAAAWRASIAELGWAGIAGALFFFLFAQNDSRNTSTQGSTIYSRLLDTLAWIAGKKPARTGRSKAADANHGGQDYSPGAAEPAPAFNPLPSGAWLWFLLAAAAFSLRDFTGNSMGSLGSLFIQNAHGLNVRSTGLVLSAIFLAAAFGCPLLGRLSDRHRFRWSAFVLAAAAIVIMSLPFLTSWMIPFGFAAYGFFFMASYPIIEAGLMESLPGRIRGRMFGLFITIGGAVGGLAHWFAGDWVDGLGPGAKEPGGYFFLFGFLGILVILSITGLWFIRRLNKQLISRSDADGIA